MSIPRDNPDLVKAKYAALSNLIPPLYFVILANSWALAASFRGSASAFLTLYCPLALTVMCGTRLVAWWFRQRNREISAEGAVAALLATKRLGMVLTTGFLAWAIALFPHGDAYARGHAVLFICTSMMASIACLGHLRSIAIFIGLAMALGMVVFCFLADNSLLFMLVGAVLVMGAMMAAMLIQNRNFQRMVAAQSRSQALIREQQRLLRMIDDMPVAVMTADPQTLRITYMNDATRELMSQIEHLLPVRVEDLPGACIDLFHKDPGHQRRVLADPACMPYKTRVRIGPEVLDLQVSAIYTRDRHYIGPMLTWELVTKEVESEERIRQLAHYDTLTGLANRTTFREELVRALAHPGKHAGLLYIDLDGFKIINDTKGHLVGDTLLRQVADRLRAACAGSDVVISRLGGDEFAVLVGHCDEQQLVARAKAVMDGLVGPYHLGGDLRVQIGASMGVAHAPWHGNDPELLLSRADIALYAAKAAGKGTFMMFCADMESRIQERVQLEGRLRSALEAGEGLFVFYQPIINIRSGRVTTREALLRWFHPERGWIPPAEFIPVAEDSGLIERLGAFVLQRACRDAVGWADDVRVAVNVSPAQLGQGTLAQTVQAALLDSGLAASRLEVEVTESALADEVHAISELRAVHALGVRVALDDFGTGYSSLAHLRSFPFDKIKVDGSFVKDAVTRSDCAAVVKAVADLGKRLGVTTVAEGVETQEHLDCVIAEGCCEVQGFYLGVPAPNGPDAERVRRVSQIGQTVAA